MPSRLTRIMGGLFVATFTRRQRSIVLVCFAKPQILGSLPLAGRLMIDLRRSDRPILRVHDVAQVVAHTLGM